ncbi:hypothetical protein A5773_13880 [Mycobacterium sp. 852014-52450_SCH5900713]|uniref:AAA family ATPase n=1 Tax=Mycobacterium sp. 852014-52450_SCH5900713 TaxID=1834116 RepID=UPI0007FCEBD3|nr:AAA family ATPase [Mycobacterium sp. 852014-52450_SCH5900713]OBF95710.1 hypothetical protein A5773_13880 [Mycobacterium sp. 852014-52450_SCH5900713]
MDSETTPPIEMPRVWRASELKPAVQPRWLARNRIPTAAVSLLVGDEGIGKSLTWVWFAAPITTGEALPEFGIPARDPADVMIICTEDGWSDTVLPRLTVAGADLDRISVICTDHDGSGAPIFPRDIHLIAEAVPSPALVVVDAWLDTVPAMLSVRDPQQARQALHPWKDLATFTDSAVMLVTHTNRIVSGNPRDRYGATGELRKKARMTLYAQTDDDGQLLVGPEKANSAAPIPASRFTIKPVQYFPPSEEHDGTVPLLVYAGTSDRTAREHLAANAEFGEEPGGNPAKIFLLDYLTREGGEAKAADVLKAGRSAGFSDQELKDARRRHRHPRIESRKARGLSEGWVWAINHEGGTPPEGGTKTAEGGEGGTQGGMPLSLPPSPPSGHLPPSEPTDSSPPNGLVPTPASMPRHRHLTAVHSHHHRTNFQPPPGASRCRECGWHIPTMGHNPTCSANSAVGEGAS